MFKNLDRQIGNGVTLLVVLAYFEFFKFTFIPSSVRSFSQLLAIGLMVVLIILKLVYQPEKLARMNFSGPVSILMIAAIPSYFIALSYHNQSFMASAYANSTIWFYLLYFFVHVFKVSVKYIIRLILSVGLFSVALYYIQLFLYPNVFMDINVMESRGTIRLFVSGLLCTQVAYFYFLNRFFEENKLYDLLLSLVTLSVFILQGTRQLLFAVVFLTLVNLFFSRRVRGRFFKIVLLGFASFTVFLIFQEIFMELTRVSASQVSDITGGIRLRAARFFLTRFQPSEWSYFFGNTSPGLESVYSQKMRLYAIRYGFYLSDIGIIGDYIKYGVLFVVAGLFMIAKSIVIKVNRQFRYLKYYILMQCFTLVTGYGILGGVDVILLLIIYIFDVDRANFNADDKSQGIIESLKLHTT